MEIVLILLVREKMIDWCIVILSQMILDQSIKIILLLK